MNNLTYICVEIAKVTYKISKIEVDVKEKKSNIEVIDKRLHLNSF